MEPFPGPPNAVFFLKKTCFFATSPIIEEKNSLAYLQDCLSLLKKSDSISRIIELKEIYNNNGLSEDETFELQQHLLSNIDKLEEPERNLLRDLSQKAN